MTNRISWKEYEEDIFSIFKSEYPSAQINFNVLRKGRYSKTNRQCDILIEDYVAGNRMTIVVDAKYYGSNVDVKDVDSFIGMLEDIGAHKGLLVTKVGYSDAALNRAHYASTDVELDILNFDELQKFQGHFTATVVGDIGFVMPSPFGWVIDARPTPDYFASVYQRGLSLEEARELNEFMVVNFWDRRIYDHSLEDVLNIHADNIRKKGIKTVSETVPTISRTDAQVILIKSIMPDHESIINYTGYVEFERFVFFCILITEKNKSERNVRKLENILSNVVQISSNNSDQN